MTWSRDMVSVFVKSWCKATRKSPNGLFFFIRWASSQQSDSIRLLCDRWQASAHKCSCNKQVIKMWQDLQITEWQKVGKQGREDSKYMLDPPPLPLHFSHYTHMHKMTGGGICILMLSFLPLFSCCCCSTVSCYILVSFACQKNVTTGKLKHSVIESVAFNLVIAAVEKGLKCMLSGCQLHQVCKNGIEQAVPRVHCGQGYIYNYTDQ